MGRVVFPQPLTVSPRREGIKWLQGAYAGPEASIYPNNTNYFGPRYETNALPVGLGFLNHPAGAPFWNAVRKIGTAILLSLPAEIYVNTRGPGEDIYWVVDHPEGGTFSARHVWVGNGTVETNEVTRFEITN